MNAFWDWLFGEEAIDTSGASGWRVALVARYDNYVILALLLVLVAMVFLTVRSYRREGDAPRRVKATLGVIRVAVFVLAMLVLFRPAIVLRFTETLYSTVAVLVDDSLSMSYTDRYGDGESRDRLSGFIGADESGLESISRSEVVRLALTRNDGVLERLAKDHPLVFLRFSTANPGSDDYTRKIGELPVASGAAEEAEPSTEPVSAEAVLSRLSASGYETNLAAGIRDAINILQGRRVAALVVISDGQPTRRGGSGRLKGALAFADQQGITRYAVITGDPTPPRNVSVTALQAPREARRGASVEFTAMLSQRNLAGQSVTVSLLRRKADEQEFSEPVATKTVTLEAPAEGVEERSRGTVSVAISLEPTEEGVFVYRAVVEPVTEERNRDDNFADATVRVSDEKIRILLLGSAPGWEFQYIRNFLLRQPELYRISVWQQNADVEINQMASSEEMKLRQLPRDLVDLVGVPGQKDKPGYSVVILCDPQPTKNGFDKQFVDMLRTFVQAHGGGLCYIAAGKHTEGVLANEGEFGALGELLPVQVGQNTMDDIMRIEGRRPQPWQVRSTSYGLEHPVMRLGTSMEDTRRVWEDYLPGIYWSHAVHRIKPGARVLAVHSNPMRRTSRNRAEPLIATQPFGKGRVLYLGFNSTWRWRRVLDGYYQRQFWSNVVRYLSPTRVYQVVITAGGDRFNSGEKISIQAEAFDDEYRPLKADTFDVYMINEETGEEEKHTLNVATEKAEDGGQEQVKLIGRFRKTITASQTGTFVLTALKGDPLAADKVAGKRITVELPQDEALRPEAEEATMQEIASSPENFLQLWEVERLGELIPPGRLEAARPRVREIWDSNLTLLLIVILLAAEWIVRKRHNMA